MISAAILSQLGAELFADASFQACRGLVKASDTVAEEKPAKGIWDYSHLPAGDALVAGTIGHSLGMHADTIEESLTGTINLYGSDFQKPSFVTAMQDMGSVSPTGLSGAVPIGLNTNFNMPESLLAA